MNRCYTIEKPIEHTPHITALKHFRSALKLQVASFKMKEYYREFEKQTLYLDFHGYYLPYLYSKDCTEILHCSSQ